jgi:hypothetical protein
MDGGSIPNVLEVHAASVFMVEEVGWVSSCVDFGSKESVRGEVWKQVPIASQ